MDSAHIHLILNHFPIIGTIIGAGVLFYGLISKNNTINKVALIIFIAMAIISIPVFLTGEGAEETVEHIIGVSENLIENHEEFAEIAIWFMMFLGILALINLIAIFRKHPYTRIITLITFVLSLVTFGIFAQVGNLGGQIRHSELRENKKQINSDTKEFLNNSKKENDDDDDDD